jgi:putative nucleotidyltransferase with HDIG domain
MKSLVPKKEPQQINLEFEENVQGVLDAFPGYIMLLDSHHHILKVNKAVVEMTGKNPDVIIGGYCPRVIHGLDHAFPGCPLEESLEKGGAVERELYDPVTSQWMISAVYPTKLTTKEGNDIYLHTAFDITKKKNNEEENKLSHITQILLAEILQISLKDVSLDEELSLILEKLTRLPWLTRELKGAIFLVDEKNPQRLVLKTSIGLDFHIKEMCSYVTFGRCLCGLAALHKKNVFASNIDERHVNTFPGMKPHGHYCLPIISSEKLLGVINLYVEAGHPFSQKEEELLGAISDILAHMSTRKIAEEKLENTVNQLRQNLGAIIQAMSATVEYRDPYTAGHQRRVADLARAIADEMGLPREKVEGIRMAGNIHDVGKIAVPSEILSKPGQLNPLEYEMVKTHSQVGYDILKNIDFPWPIAEIVRQHHERLDGSGYPSGLAGNEILLEARVLAVADVVEAMASHRPYRPSRGLDIALDEITSKKGILYDPEVVEACQKLFLEKGFKFK